MSDTSRYQAKAWGSRKIIPTRGLISTDIATIGNSANRLRSETASRSSVAGVVGTTKSEWSDGSHQLTGRRLTCRPDGDRSIRRGLSRGEWIGCLPVAGTLVTAPIWDGRGGHTDRHLRSETFSTQRDLLCWSSCFAHRKKQQAKQRPAKLTVFSC